MKRSVKIQDDSDSDKQVPDVAYEVVSYGSDLDVEGLVARLSRGDIVIPSFQRDFIWPLREASRFIESLLLGLPVPGVFFSTEPETNKLLVIDGQQRLKTLLFFKQGYFKPKTEEKKRIVFRLTEVQERFNGRTYDELEERDKLRLNNSVIHATIVKQTAPPKDDTSVFHIFERLNSGGRRLSPQEIRVALYHGPLIDGIRELNNHKAWRDIFGVPNARLKDQELILRFFALQEDAAKYSRPMREFLSKYAGRRKRVSPEHLEVLKSSFRNTVDRFADALGKSAFRPSHAVNAAVFDSCMVGLSRRLADGPPLTKSALVKAYNALLKDKEYVKATSRSTADEAFVSLRIERAIAVFAQA